MAGITSKQKQFLLILMKNRDAYRVREAIFFQESGEVRIYPAETGKEARNIRIKDISAIRITGSTLG